MKQFLMGFIWFIVFFFLTTLIHGTAVGIYVGIEMGDLSAEDSAKVIKERHDAVSGRYSSIAFLLSLIAATVGTTTGFLPGTKKKGEANDANDAS